MKYMYAGSKIQYNSGKCFYQTLIVLYVVDSLKTGSIWETDYIYRVRFVAYFQTNCHKHNSACHSFVDYNHL